MSHTPIYLYSAHAVRELDRIAINTFEIPSYDLMKRAGRALFLHLQNMYPRARELLVCCGAGNNAGDGYVVAKLALIAGLHVKVISLVDPLSLKGDASKAWYDWQSAGGSLSKFTEQLLQQADVIVDALIGTGLQRPVEGEWKTLIKAVNQSNKPVIAVDIPSGLNADNGKVLGEAIQANSTLTFIGLKKGLMTHQGVDYCGELLLDELSIPSGVYLKQAEQAKQAGQAQLLDWEYLKTQIKSRKISAHKHQSGHVFVLGGDMGMPGAIRMAAEAALKSGAGLVTVVSRLEHLNVLLAGRPELMIYPTTDGHVSIDVLSNASAIVVGPGLTDSPWSQNLFASALASAVPMVVDAGALRLLSKQPCHRDNWVLTPHTGEAAALSGRRSAEIQDARFESIEQLQQQYGGHIVLKGAGSLVQSANEITQLCPYGNSGMATAGMGDVLSGIIASLIAQSYSLSMAARLGVCLHAMAGDRAAGNEPLGLLASDLFAPIRQLMNNHE